MDADELRSLIRDMLPWFDEALLGKNYDAAFRIFRALLIPVGKVDIDLGQHEMLDEVLGVDPAVCATQYVVSMYMTSASKNRGKAVLSAIDEMQGIDNAPCSASWAATSRRRPSSSVPRRGSVGRAAIIPVTCCSRCLSPCWVASTYPMSPPATSTS